MQNNSSKTGKNSPAYSESAKTKPQSKAKTSKSSESAVQKKCAPQKKYTSPKQCTKTVVQRKDGKSRKKEESFKLYDSFFPSRLSKKPSVKIKFLGGLNEIGKNLTLYEYNDEIIILDCGMSFPDADMPGVDYVLPDITYIARNSSKVKAVFITHGHEDHIGGLPYLLKTVNAPVYCTRLTAGLIKGKLKEYRMLNKCSIKEIKPGDSIKAGAFTVEAIHVNHSIPDSLAFAVRCPAGISVHTGDFKIDNMPIDGGVIDLPKLAALGNEGVLCLLSDSTNAERPGYTPSERNVGDTLETLFRDAHDRRIIVASFASNIHRIQQIVDAAQKIGRKVFLSGRSLENATAISMELGYMNIPDGVLFSIDKLRNYRDEDVVIITTGSQGEPMSALSRMALNDHRQVSVGRNDYIIISANPIPGNEKTVSNTINELMKLGAEVIYEKSLGIHVSGHASQEEQKLILNLVRPKYFIPIHGEQKHLRRHAETARSVGIPEENIIIPDLGMVIEASDSFIDSSAVVPTGRILVDSSGACEVGKSILRDRKRLSTDGIIIVTAVTDSYSGELISHIDVQTKGFAFEPDANELQNMITKLCEKLLYDFQRNVNADIHSLKTKLKDGISKSVFDKTRRSPIVVVTVLSI